MSTRSAIIEKLPDGTYRGVYCHFDGYLSNNGKLLYWHYQDPSKVSQLIDLGELRCLGKYLAPTNRNKEMFVASEERGTEAYCRDQGEDYVPPLTGKTADAVASQIGHNGHVYVFRDGVWYHNSDTLKEALEAEGLLP